MARPHEGFYGFDGLDWDIEGHDDKASPYNHFTVECLNVMGEMSVLAKQDGYLVTMAPPESYLDPFSNDFTRSLRNTLPEWRELVPDFTYHGINSYAFLLGKYGKTNIGPGPHTETNTQTNTDTHQYTTTDTTSQCTLVDTFDLVIYQLYESYGHANYHVEVKKGNASEWLVSLVRRMQQGWMVNFSSDAELNFPDTVVKVAPHQLVIGLANAWAHDSEKDSAIPGIRKTLFLRPSELQQAATQLQQNDTALRGFAFWSLIHEGDVIASSGTGSEGDGGAFYMAKELNAIMRTR